MKPVVAICAVLVLAGSAMAQEDYSDLIKKFGLDAPIPMHNVPAPFSNQPANFQNLFPQTSNTQGTLPNGSSIGGVIVGLSDADEVVLHANAEAYAEDVRRENNFQKDIYLLQSDYRESIKSDYDEHSKDVEKLISKISIRRFENAAIRTFTQEGIPISQYLIWKMEFNQSQDIFAYGIDMMTPQKWSAYYDGLNDIGKRKFENSLMIADKLGLMSRPEGQSNENHRPH